MKTPIKFKNNKEILVVPVRLNPNMAEFFIQHGINPERILDFLERNIEANREVLNVSKDTLSKKEFFNDSVSIHEAEILKLILQDSLSTKTSNNKKDI